LVIRVVRGLVAAEHVDRLHDRVRRLAVGVRSSPGCVRAFGGRQVLPDCGERIFVVSVWRTMDELYAWLGGNDLLDSPIHGKDRLFLEFEVQHYESLDPQIDWIAVDGPASSGA
jgi:hypothetical protein